MAIVFTQVLKEPGLRSMRIVGTLAFTGNYVVSGEVPSGIVKPHTTKNPIMVKFSGRTSNEYAYDPATGKVLVFAPGGAELTAAAYPAGVTGDAVTMELEYPKFG